jgi:hypothetical protein
MLCFGRPLRRPPIPLGIGHQAACRHPSDGAMYNLNSVHTNQLKALASAFHQRSQGCRGSPVKALPDRLKSA